MLRQTIWEIQAEIFGILSVELEGVCARMCKSDRVIVFRLVILNRAQGVNNFAQNCKCVLF